ncbi:hypothetical protein Gogos_020089, partial [Gossypium gossypioides]|nr:hypothetical protein [Gossypium gossypioides]
MGYLEDGTSQSNVLWHLE